MNFPKFLRPVFLTLPLALVFLSCGGSDDTQDPLPSSSLATKYAVVATGASDYSSGAHSTLTYSEPRSATNDLLPTISDLKISSYGKFFYRMERLGSNSITKFSIDDPSTPIWQYSTDEAGDTNSNPSALIVINDVKAYLLRYNSSKAWIVNPSATNEADFKIGELDLSAYDEGDGAPEMASAVRLGGRLFIALQRYSMALFAPDESYIAVFNIDTDTEIDTDPSTPGLKGIKLDVRNPDGEIKYNDGYIYVPGADDMWGGSATFGGIQRVNTTTYAVDPIMIGTTNKNITRVEIISPTKGYLIKYEAIWIAPWSKTHLMSFNPQTGTVDPANVAGIGNSGDRNLQDIAADSDGLLWVADGSATDPGIYIIDPATDTIQEGPISTNLNPLDIVFCEK